MPAHVGVQGNERADQLAKSAVSRSPTRYPIPFRDFHTIIKNALRRSWQQEWDEVGPNKLKELTSSTHPSWSYAGLSRKFETLLCRLRIGHTH